MTVKRAVASDDEVRPTIADDDGLLCPVEFLETQPFLKSYKKMKSALLWFVCSPLLRAHPRR